MNRCVSYLLLFDLFVKGAVKLTGFFGLKGGRNIHILFLFVSVIKLLHSFNNIFLHRMELIPTVQNYSHFAVKNKIPVS